ncbi:MAG: hypothetical protein VX613_02745, partial [Candidatus Thermoplasmatota archaeon]|nr:hypothetical protein [Candidatus Thermoplasmatota archaeon]
MADGEMQIENIDETDKERRKFNLIPGEDLMQIHRPSLFAFAGMYVMAFLVGAVHYIWTFMPSEAPGEPGVIQEILWSFVSSSLGESIGFPLVMLFLAWFNRWMNISSSTKWFTMTMIFIAALPFTAWMINAFAADSPVNFLDGSYPYQIAGIFWIAFLFVNIYYFQRSFCYAIT